MENGRSNKQSEIEVSGYLISLRNIQEVSVTNEDAYIVTLIVGRSELEDKISFKGGEFETREE